MISKHLLKSWHDSTIKVARPTSRATKCIIYSNGILSLLASSHCLKVWSSELSSRHTPRSMAPQYSLLNMALYWNIFWGIAHFSYLRLTRVKGMKLVFCFHCVLCTFILQAQCVTHHMSDEKVTTSTESVIIISNAKKVISDWNSYFYILYLLIFLVPSPA